MLTFIQFIEPSKIHIPVTLHQHLTICHFYLPKNTKLALKVKGNVKYHKNLTTFSISITTVDISNELHQFKFSSFFLSFLAHSQAQRP